MRATRTEDGSNHINKFLLALIYQIHLLLSRVVGFTLSERERVQDSSFPTPFSLIMDKNGTEYRNRKLTACGSPHY